MQVIGIVAEYNPFHTGHAYQIHESRRLVGADSAVVAVMSGNWVQQADCAIADKWLRTRLALMGGVDLVPPCGPLLRQRALPGGPSPCWRPPG